MNYWRGISNKGFIWQNGKLLDVIQAEAIAADKSVSALLREWIEERLDLATA
jgi:hypothetical protein